LKSFIVFYILFYINSDTKFAVDTVGNVNADGTVTAATLSAGGSTLNSSLYVAGGIKLSYDEALNGQVNNITSSTYILYIASGSTTAQVNLSPTTPANEHIVTIVNTTSGARSLYSSSYYDFTNTERTTIPANSSVTVQYNGTRWQLIQYSINPF